MIDISVLIPIYLLMLIGFAAVKSGYFPAQGVATVSQFVLKICVPVLIFLALFRMNGKGVLNGGFIVGYGFASFAGYFFLFAALTRVFKISRPKAALFSIGGAGSNSIFIGFPVAQAIVGNLAELSLAWVLIVENLMLIPLALLLHDVFCQREAANHNKSDFAKTLLTMMKNPILLAIVLGLVLPVVVKNLWPPLAIALDYIKAATTALSLLLIGGFLARSRYQWGQWAIPLVVFGKLILHPLLVMLVFYGLGLTNPFLLTGVIFASMSVFGVYANFCELEHEGQFGASVYLLSTLLAPLSLWFFANWVS